MTRVLGQAGGSGCASTEASTQTTGSLLQANDGPTGALTTHSVTDFDELKWADIAIDCASTTRETRREIADVFA